VGTKLEGEFGKSARIQNPAKSIRRESIEPPECAARYYRFLKKRCKYPSTPDSVAVNQSNNCTLCRPNNSSEIKQYGTTPRFGSQLEREIPKTEKSVRTQVTLYHV
jgi:hypothetical protein